MNKETTDENIIDCSAWDDLTITQLMDQQSLLTDRYNKIDSIINGSSPQSYYMIRSALQISLADITQLINQKQEKTHDRFKK